jgi:ribosomal protein L40E
MARRFLKRFEKLENIPTDGLIMEDIKISKRFERLEIGDKKIEVAITDKIVQEEVAPPEVVYNIICRFCGADNPSNAQACILCRHPLQAQPTEAKVTLGYQAARKRIVKKCMACGATNLEERRICWVCGKAFFGVSKENIALDPGNVITLNIDGKVYKSTDEKLPLDIKILMLRIRNEGYNKEIIDAWIKEMNEKIDARNRDITSNLWDIRRDLNIRIAGLILSIVLSLLWLRSCHMTTYTYR